MDQSTFFNIVMLVFNVATIAMLALVVSRADFKSIMQEKSPEAQPSVTDGNAEPPESYSRLAGMLGAVLMVTFFWATCNVVLYHAIQQPDNVGNAIDGVGTFLLYGSALFLPYAANQVRAIFTPSTKKA